MAEKHFYQQIEHTKNYLFEYFEKHIPDFKTLKILEIGCAEAGFVHYLNSMNIDVQGLELVEARVNIALEKNPRLNLTVGDITKSEVVKKLNAKFDLIVMRDVIEHIPQRKKMFENIVRLLNPRRIFVRYIPAAFFGIRRAPAKRQVHFEICSVRATAARFFNQDFRQYFQRASLHDWGDRQ